MKKTSPQIALYFCGGAGMNIGNMFSQSIKDNAILQDKVRMYFIDTSAANQHPVNNDDNTLILGEQKGSGKIRAKNYTMIKDSVPEIMHKFEPGAFNILVSSTSGGSGATIQGVLLSEMLGKDIPVVNVSIGSMDSEREVENTHRAFLSYEAIVKARKKPVCVFYRQNSEKNTRGAVDGKVLSALTLLSLMFSCVADKIDDSDLRHFLNYPLVTRFPATVAGLDFFTENLTPLKDETLFTVTTLGTADVSTTVTPTPPYQSTGFLTTAHAQMFADVKVLHWAVMGGSYDELIREAAGKIDEYESAASAYRATTHVTDKQQVEDDGMVL